MRIEKENIKFNDTYLNTEEKKISAELDRTDELDKIAKPTEEENKYYGVYNLEDKTFKGVLNKEKKLELTEEEREMIFEEFKKYIVEEMKEELKEEYKDEYKEEYLDIDTFEKLEEIILEGIKKMEEEIDLAELCGYYW